MRHVATFVGLGIALLGPPMMAALTPRLLRGLSATKANLLGQLGLWCLGGLIVNITLFWEQRPLSSLGLIRPTWQTFLWGAIIAAGLLYVVSPVGAWLVGWLRLPDFESGLSKLRDIPASVLLLGALSAGVVEELLYRGYAIERLSELTGHRVWLGALLSLLSFALAHWPFWGLGSVVFTFIGGSCLTLLYVWKRDLGANMLAHTLTAIVQLLAISNT